MSRLEKIVHRHRAAVLVAVVMTLAGLVPAGVAPRADAATSPTAFSFGPSGFDGAGFQNVVAIDPFGSGVVIAGGDVAGFHRSTDNGKTWSAANIGVKDLVQMRVGALLFSPVQAGTIYAAAGGLYASTDYGQTWSMRSNLPFNAGNTTAPGLPSTHPRSTGNLLAMDPAGRALYAGTFGGGLRRSTDGGFTWTTLGLQDLYIRGIALDPADPNVLYVATYGSGIYRTSSALGSGTFTRLAASPATPEELLVLGGRVYTAAGPDGVFQSSDAGATWVRIGTAALRNDGPVWMSIAGYQSGGQNVLYAGSMSPTQTSSGFDSIMRSDDSGATWRSVTTTARIDTHIAGPSGRPWWLATTQPTMMLGKGGYVAAHLVIDQANRDRVLVAGRSGLWGTENGGQNWYPYVRGLGATINRDVEADPNAANALYIANTDWVLLTSSDGGETIQQRRPPSGNTGFDIAVDGATSPSTVFVGVGDRDVNSQGEVWSNANVLGAGTWVDEGLSNVAGGLRPIGIAVGSAGDQRVIIAAVEGSGIWRKVGASWSKVNAVAVTSQSTRQASFVWPRGSSIVYLYDDMGVWRSNDRGLTWVKIWNEPSTQERTGYIAVDPINDGVLYVSVSNKGLYRLDGADSGTVGGGITVTALAGSTRPGPVAVDTSGTVYLTQLVSSAAAAGLFASSDRGATWTSVADGHYRGSALYPFGLARGGNGRLYLALSGTGVIVGQAGSDSDTQAPGQTVTAPEANSTFESGTALTLAGTAADDRAVAAVNFSLGNDATGQWLRRDGTWGAYERIPATLSSPGGTSTSWSATVATTAPGDHVLRVEATDAAGNSAPETAVRFAMVAPDTTPPSQTVTVPAMDQVFTSAQVTMTGTAADDRGIAGVKVALYDRTAGQWLRADGTWGAWQQHQATLVSQGAGTTDWSYRFTPPTPGLYGLQVEATDTSGNLPARTWVRFETQNPDTVAPTVSVTAPGAGSTVPQGSVSLRGAASDNWAVDSVRIAVLDRSRNVWLHADGTWGAYQEFPAALATPGVTATTWSRSVPLRKGEFSLEVRAVDSAGTTSPKITRVFSVSRR